VAKEVEAVHQRRVVAPDHVADLLADHHGVVVDDEEDLAALGVGRGEHGDPVDDAQRLVQRLQHRLDQDHHAALRAFHQRRDVQAQADAEYSQEIAVVRHEVGVEGDIVGGHALAQAQQEVAGHAAHGLGLRFAHAMPVRLGEVRFQLLLDMGDGVAVVEAAAHQRQVDGAVVADDQVGVRPLDARQAAVQMGGPFLKGSEIGGEPVVVVVTVGRRQRGLLGHLTSPEGGRRPPAVPVPAGIGAKSIRQINPEFATR